MWKLQKLVYYSQAWHLVWEDEELFPERIEAWANGPVVPALYSRHRGDFKVSEWKHGDPSKLMQVERESIDLVLDFYGDKPGHWLSELTHQEPPWVEARGDLPPQQRGNRQITPAAMQEYYSSLV